MSSRTTRINKQAEIIKDPNTTPSAVLEANLKVFYVAEALVHDPKELVLEHFYHPGSGENTLFATANSTSGEAVIMELIEHTETHRSWFIGNEVCSNGSIYITTPIDSTLLALHHLRKHCKTRALSLDSINDDQYASTNRLLTNFVRPDSLKMIADVKCFDDTKFYKYNEQRALAWLAIKTRQVADALKNADVHCGQSAISQNYTENASEDVCDSTANMNRLRTACDIVGVYLDDDLYEALETYLELPSEMKAMADELASAAGKRKSGKQLKAGDYKKVKLEKQDDAERNAEEVGKPQPLKERALTTKEKALAKSAKGTKTIASFFKK